MNSDPPAIDLPLTSNLPSNKHIPSITTGNSILARVENVDIDLESIVDAQDNKISQKSTLTSKRKRIYLSDCLAKLINLLRQKDQYGFFLSPVDLRVVPDYSRIIKKPMDLGTMKTKVKKKKYLSCQEFASDFELVIQNTKTYNAPDSIYYIAADKLHIAGMKLIEKESEFVVPDIEVDLQAGISPPMPPQPERSARKIQGKQDDQKISRRSIKKAKHSEDLENLMSERIYTDGTLSQLEFEDEKRRCLDPFTYFCQTQPVQLLDSIGNSIHSVFKNWSLPPPKPRNSLEDQNTYMCYGTNRGREYIKSLEEFTAGIDSSLFDTPTIIDRLTCGSHYVNIATKAFLNQTSTTDTVNVQCGSAIISEQIKELENEFDGLIKLVRLDEHRKNSTRCAVLQLTNNQTENLNSIPCPQLLTEIFNDLEYAANNAMAIDRGPRIDRVRQKLLSLILYTKDPIFEINVPSNQLGQQYGYQAYNTKRFIANTPVIKPQHEMGRSTNPNIQPITNIRPASTNRCLNCGNPAQPSNNGIHMCQGIIDFTRMYIVLYAEQGTSTNSAKLVGV